MNFKIISTKFGSNSLVHFFFLAKLIFCEYKEASCEEKRLFRVMFTQTFVRLVTGNFIDLNSKEKVVCEI